MVLGPATLHRLALEDPEAREGRMNGNRNSFLIRIATSAIVLSAVAFVGAASRWKMR
jgi:hypothetical protein